MERCIQWKIDYKSSISSNLIENLIEREVADKADWRYRQPRTAHPNSHTHCH